MISIKGRGGGGGIAICDPRVNSELSKAVHMNKGELDSSQMGERLLMEQGTASE